MKHANIDQLYYFSQIAKRGNMTAAANELYVAQSALSIALANLEKNLGVKLFEREKGRLVLNEYGKILLRYTDIILQNYNQAITEIESRKKQDSKTIRIGLINEYFYADAILAFSSTHPDIDIIQCIISPQLLQSDQFIHSDYDFIFGTIPFCEQGLSYDIITEEDLYVLMPKDHPLAVKSSVTLSDLNGETMIIPGSGYSFHDFTLHLIESEGVQPQNIKECMLSIIHEMVIESNGVAIVVNSMRRANLTDSRLRKLPIETHVKRQKVLIYPDKSILSPAKRAFRDYIVDFFGKKEPCTNL